MLLFGTVLILVAQESESDEIRKELMVVATQVDQLLESEKRDHLKRGVAGRLNNKVRRNRHEAFKSIGFFLLMLASMYTIL